MQELDAWRKKIGQLRFSTQGPAQCRDGALHYYKLVTHAEHHFRGSSLKELKLLFRWHDTFNPKLSVAQPDWRFERAAVLFNIAASLSYLATLQDRGDPEGMKLSCKYFQEAAGAISEVRSVSREAAWVEYTPDMTNEFLQAIESLMLAQAQKCFYEKAVADGRPHALIAKLAAECAALYAEAWLKLSTPVLQESIAGEWLAIVDWNRQLFDGVQNFYAASIHAAANEYGPQVSRLTHAVNKCAEAVNLCRKAAPELQAQFKAAHAMARDAHAKAKHDNDMVYFEKVPPLATLPKLQRAAMVKPIKLPELNVEPPEEQAPAPPPPEPAPAEVAESGVATVTAGMGSVAMGGEGDALMPGPPPPPPSFDEATSAGVDDLMAMGFGREAAQAALEQAGGSVQEASALLLQVPP